MDSPETHSINVWVRWIADLMKSWRIMNVYVKTDTQEVFLKFVRSYHHAQWIKNTISSPKSVNAPESSSNWVLLASVNANWIVSGWITNVYVNRELRGFLMLAAHALKALTLTLKGVLASVRMLTSSSPPQILMPWNVNLVVNSLLSMQIGQNAHAL